MVVYKEAFHIKQRKINNEARGRRKRKQDAVGSELGAHKMCLDVLNIFNIGLYQVRYCQ